MKTSAREIAYGGQRRCHMEDPNLGPENGAKSSTEKGEAQLLGFPFFGPELGPYSGPKTGTTKVTKLRGRAGPQHGLCMASASAGWRALASATPSVRTHGGDACMTDSAAASACRKPAPGILSRPIGRNPWERASPPPAPDGAELASPLHGGQCEMRDFLILVLFLWSLARDLLIFVLLIWSLERIACAAMLRMPWRFHVGLACRSVAVGQLFAGAV